ncbi:hypothetical protein VTO73DRAFT_14727 [Trametes versicolor]
MDSDNNPSTAPAAAPEGNERDGFLDNILTPGSSLNPTFLFIVDGALGLLLVVLLSLFILTRGNLHLLFLMVIECCLWASIKWFVHELQQAPSQDQAPGADGGSQPGPKLKDE